MNGVRQGWCRRAVLTLGVIAAVVAGRVWQGQHERQQADEAVRALQALGVQVLQIPSFGLLASYPSGPRQAARPDFAVFVRGSQCTGEVLDQLRRLPGLHQLRISGSGWDESLAVRCRELSTLRTLELYDTAVTAPTLSTLRQALPDAEILVLDPLPTDGGDVPASVHDPEEYPLGDVI